MKLFNTPYLNKIFWGIYLTMIPFLALLVFKEYSVAGSIENYIPYVLVIFAYHGIMVILGICFYAVDELPESPVF